MRNFLIISWVLFEFDGMLYFQGFEGIFGGIVVIFNGVESDEILDFVGFCRTHYRTRKW